MSEQGDTYSAFIEGELKAERERRSTYDSRGQGIVTTSGALVTLLGGFATVVKTSATAGLPATAVTALGVAFLLFIGAAACGIVAGWNRHYAVTATTTLRRMTEEHWTDDEVDARNNVAAVRVGTVGTLRRANQFKATWVSIGLIVQVVALMASVVAVAVLVTTL